MDTDKKVILFGAGQIGKMALRYFGPERVYCFVDNNEKLLGERVLNIPVLSFSQLKKVHMDYRIVISTDAEKAFAIAAQLEDAGIRRYEAFFKMMREEAEKRAAGIVTYDPLCLGWKGKDRALIIAPYFRSPSDSNVFPSLRFIRHLPQFEWHPILFAVPHSQPACSHGEAALLRESEISTGIPVIHIPDPTGDSQENLTPELRERIREFSEEIFQDDGEINAQYASVSESKTGVEKGPVFPDSVRAWAYRTARYIEAIINIDDLRVIYTASAPYGTHLVAYYLKHKYGIPWVADYRDRRCGDADLSADSSAPYDKFPVSLEAVLLRNADCTIVPGTPGIAEYYMDQFQLPEGKIVSIASGCDEGEFSESRHPSYAGEFERKVLTKRLTRIFESVKIEREERRREEPLEIPSEFYDAVYKSDRDCYVRYSQSSYYSCWKEAIQLLRSHVSVSSAVDILEIGCGAGQFANILYDNGFTNYTGFDYAAEAVSLAKKNNPKQADRFFVADAFQTDLMKSNYDLVVCFEVLEHIQKDLELLGRVRSGTRMLLSVPNFNSRSHVRYFSGAMEVRERYQQVMRISDIHIARMNEKECLYYIWGEKL